MDVRTSANIHPITEESSDTIGFLERLRPAGPWVFTTIVPDGPTVTRTFSRGDECDARDFVAERNVKENIYYTVNPTKTSVNKKPSKADIDRVEYLHVDADPNGSETPDQFKARLLPKVEQFAHQPTFVIDSGNGIHLLWRLDTPVKLTSQAEIADIEARNYGLARQFGADPVTRNVDRILRAPGTTNHPNAKKRKDGRTDVPAKLIAFNDVSTTLDAFPPHPEAISSRSSNKDRRGRDKGRTWLPQDAFILLQLTSKEGYASRSELLFAFLTRAIRAGVDGTKIAQACLDSKYAGNAIHAHCQDNGGAEYVHRQLERAQEKAREDSEKYFAKNGSMFWKKPENQIVQLANFSARIVEDIKVDDGSAQVRRHFTIQCYINGREVRARISADQFDSLNWITRELGADACITPGPQLRAHLGNAMRSMDRDSRQTGTSYAHLGWREIDGQWLYLHADGAIGVVGPVDGIRIELEGELSRFALSATAVADPLSAVRASLRMLEMAPRRTTWPLLAATYLAPLGEFLPITVALFFTGGSGTRKSTMQAIAQGHWYWQDGKKLPGNWSSTANSLEGLAFRAKDALLVIDDFCPKGALTDVQRYHQTAERLIRAQGNQAGRGRMHADGRLRTEMYPRGLLAASGEDTPSGHSLRARMIVCEISPPDVDLQVLTELQMAAGAGVLKDAMASYIKFVAGQDKSVFKGRLTELRAEAARRVSGHTRTPENAALLMVGVENLLAFAASIGADLDGQKLRSDAWEALLAIGNEQDQHQRDEQPTERFKALLHGLLSSGGAHIRDARSLGPPEGARMLGWTEKEYNDKLSLLPGGRSIGWIDEREGDFYLEPDATYAELQQFAQRQGQPLTLTRGALWKRLNEAGLLEPGDERGRHTVKKCIDGCRRRVLHLKLSKVLEIEERLGRAI